MDLYFASLLAHNLPLALFVLAVTVFSRRKAFTLTPVRAVYVLLIGWIGGSLLHSITHLSFGMTGTLVGDRSEDAPLAILAILPVLYASHAWMSQSKNKGLDTARAQKAIAYDGGK
jgi:hypothetical protein